MQYEVKTTNINSPTGSLLQTIDNVQSVQDIGWEEGSNNITITTDNQVHINIFTIYCSYSSLSCAIGLSVPSGDVLRVIVMCGVHRGRLISSLWLVYSGGQVFSEVSVSQQLSAREMGPELQRVYLHCCLPTPVHSGLPHHCKWNHLYLHTFQHFPI